MQQLSSKPLCSVAIDHPPCLQWAGSGRPANSTLALTGLLADVCASPRTAAAVQQYQVIALVASASGSQHVSLPYWILQIPLVGSDPAKGVVTEYSVKCAVPDGLQRVGPLLLAEVDSSRAPG